MLYANNVYTGTISDTKVGEKALELTKEVYVFIRISFAYVEVVFCKKSEN